LQQQQEQASQLEVRVQQQTSRRLSSSNKRQRNSSTSLQQLEQLKSAGQHAGSEGALGLPLQLQIHQQLLKSNLSRSSSRQAPPGQALLRQQLQTVQQQQQVVLAGVRGQAEASGPQQPQLRAVLAPAAALVQVGG
jgi:hypothetical protein